MEILLTSLLFFLLILTTFLGRANSEIGNYVLKAYESALATQEIFEFNVETYRRHLTSEAKDFGFYLTDQMIIAMKTPPTTEEQGEELEFCARRAAGGSREAINAFDYHLVELQDASINLHLTVYAQLSETNLKDIHPDEFYDRHNKRMEDQIYNLYNRHLDRIYYQIVELWLAYFVIANELDDCIEAALLT